MTNLIDQCDRIEGAGMTTGAAGNQNESVNTCVNCFAGVTRIGDIMQDEAAVGMYALDHRVWCMQRGNENRYFVLGTDFKIAFPARI